MTAAIRKIRTDLKKDLMLRSKKSMGLSRFHNTTIGTYKNNTATMVEIYLDIQAISRSAKSICETIRRAAVTAASSQTSDLFHITGF